MTILQKILEQKAKDVSGLSSTLKNAHPAKSKRDFKKAISKTGDIPRLIAEIKKASPSRGDIFPGADTMEIAEIYAQNGAAALSVLTDTEFFNGSLADLHGAVRSTDIPILRKDFIIDQYQILEARLSGADAVLLMVSVLKDTDIIASLLQYAKSLNMDCLVETHDAAEIEVAVTAGADIIGINARSFSDLSVDTKIFAKLLPLVPNRCVKVAESGISSRATLEAIAPYCDAVLVGTHFMQTRDYDQIGKLTKELTQ